MKKWMVAVVILLVLGYVDGFPFEQADAGELCVVETLLVETDSAGITLYSMDGRGWGATMEEAVENLRENVPGQLFLRQVKRVIYCQGTESGDIVLEMPEAIPLGAHIYMYPQSAEEILDGMDLEEKRLTAREQREKNIPTLAELQNEVLKGYE